MVGRSAEIEQLWYCYAAVETRGDSRKLGGPGGLGPEASEAAYRAGTHHAVAGRTQVQADIDTDDGTASRVCGPPRMPARTAMTLLMSAPPGLVSAVLALGVSCGNWGLGGRHAKVDVCRTGN